jgi:flagellar motor switch protein FliM
MNKLLSQDEVDSLLKGLDTGDISTFGELEGSGEDLPLYDWATAGLNIRGNMPLLEVINSRFSQKFRGTLSNALRKMIDVTPDPVATVKYRDFQKSLPVPTSMHLFKMEPLRGLGILVVESRLVFSLVEAFFGGSGSGSTKIEGREFTSIEKKIIEKVVQMALFNLVEAWEEINPIKTEFVRSESNPLIVNVVPGEELLISSKFEIEMNKVLGNIIICVPYTAYQPIRNKLAGHFRDETQVTQLDRVWIEGLQRKLMGTQVEMVVNLGRSSLSIKDFMNLKEGDIIVLDNESRKPIMAQVKGIPLYEGFAGRYKNKKVFKVEQPYISQV